jgi:hypothetical protein
MGAGPGKPNELSPITRIDTAGVRPVQSAVGRGLIEPGSPWQNPFVASFGVPATAFCEAALSPDLRRLALLEHCDSEPTSESHPGWSS